MVIPRAGGGGGGLKPPKFWGKKDMEGRSIQLTKRDTPLRFTPLKPHPPNSKNVSMNLPELFVT